LNTLQPPHRHDTPVAIAEDPPSQPAMTNPVVRVVRFGVRTPTRGKAALLDDALRRQTFAYSRALKAVQAEAVRWLRADAQSRRAALSNDRRADARTSISDAKKAIGTAAYRAAKIADTSSIMADAIAKDVLRTLASWIGWRRRFRTERPGRIRKAEALQTEALADIPAAVARLQARRPRATITEAHVRTSVATRVRRERQRRPPAYPVGRRVRPAALDRAAVLDALAISTSKAEEDRLRDALAAQPRCGVHPLAWVRPQSDRGGRGVSLFWDNNRLFAFLPGLLPADALRFSKPLDTKPKRLVGVTEPVQLKQTGGIILPLQFSRAAWAYLDGWTPRTARLVKVEARYELHVAFIRHLPVRLLDPACWIGIDRGVVNTAAMAYNQGEGGWASGNPLTHLEQRLRRQRETRQRQGGAKAMQASKRQFRAAARNVVNRIAKHIVAEVVRQRAHVSAEDLKAFARGDARMLSKAQYARLLRAVEQGLERQGYPPYAKGGRRIWQVRAAGTSQRCAACRHQSAANRPERGIFRCVACGHTADPDINAAVNIARRGQETSLIRKDQSGGAVGLSASAGRVVARPASADGTIMSPAWSEKL
jgi:transposase